MRFVVCSVVVSLIIKLVAVAGRQISKEEGDKPLTPSSSSIFEVWDD